MSDASTNQKPENFTSLFDLVSGFGAKAEKVEELASTIEQIGIYCFDDYHRYTQGAPGSQIATSALSELAEFYRKTWVMDEHDLSEYLSLYSHNFENRPALALYGWHGKLPEFLTHHENWLADTGVINPPVMVKEPRSGARVYVLIAAMLKKELDKGDYLDFLTGMAKGNKAAKKIIDEALKSFGETISGPPRKKIMVGAINAGMRQMKKEKDKN